MLRTRFTPVAVVLEEQWPRRGSWTARRRNREISRARDPLRHPGPHSPGGRLPRLTTFAPAATVVSWTPRRQQVRDIEFPPRNRAAPSAGTPFPPPPSSLQDSGGLQGTGQRVDPQLVARFDPESRASPPFLEYGRIGFDSRRLHPPKPTSHAPAVAADASSADATTGLSVAGRTKRGRTPSRRIRSPLAER
jgi:hypothetical protein